MTDMGVVYSIVCKTCRKWRDLDKLRTCEVDNQADAEEYAYAIKLMGAYRPALLVSFMADHMGHDCTLIDDYDSAFDGITDGFEEDKGYWEENPDD